MLINLYEDIHADILEGVNTKGYKTFVFTSLKNTDKKIVSEFEIYHFTELLNSFLCNQLITGKRYQNSGFTGKLVSQKKVIYLLLEMSEKKYYLDKYDARVISQKINKILSRCTLKEFL